MKRRYLDNAATSFPKPPQVLEAVSRYATELGASPGRGAYDEVKQTGRLFDECRERINTLINGRDARHVIFTLNASDALNMAIRGIVHGPAEAGTQVVDHGNVKTRPDQLSHGVGPDIARTTGHKNIAHVCSPFIQRRSVPHT